MRTVVPANFDLVREAAVAVDNFGRRVAESEGVLQPLPGSVAVGGSCVALRCDRVSMSVVGIKATPRLKMMSKTVAASCTCGTNKPCS